MPHIATPEAWKDWVDALDRGDADPGAPGESFSDLVDQIVELEELIESLAAERDAESRRSLKHLRKVLDHKRRLLKVSDLA